MKQLIVVALVIIGLFSCRKTATDEKTVNIVYREGDGSVESEQTKYYRKLSDEFEALTGYKLNPRPIIASEADYFTKVALMMQSDPTLDLVHEDSFLVQADAVAGYLTPLNEFIDSWDDFDKLYPSLIEGYKVDEKIYGIPFNTDARGLFYSRKVFSEAGLPEDWEPRSWDDILSAATVISTNTDYTPFAFQGAAAMGEATTMQTFQMLLYGTEDAMYEEGNWVVESQGMVDTLRFINRAFKQGLLPSVDVMMQSNASDLFVKDYFAKETLGIFLNGVWISGDLFRIFGEEAQERIKFVAMPTQFGQGAGFTSMSGGWGFAIPTKARNKEVSWQAIEFLMGADKLSQKFKVDGNLVSRMDVAENDADYRNHYYIAQASSFLPFTHLRPANEQYNSVSVEVQRAVAAVVSGAATPEEAMSNYAAAVSRRYQNVSQKSWD